MGESLIAFMPFAFGFGWLVGQSTWARTCPKCGATLGQNRSINWSEQRRAWIGIALIGVISFMLWNAVYWLSRPAPKFDTASPPVALPKGPPA